MYESSLRFIESRTVLFEHFLLTSKPPSVRKSSKGFFQVFFTQIKQNKFFWDLLLITWTYPYWYCIKYKYLSLYSSKFESIILYIETQNFMVSISVLLAFMFFLIYKLISKKKIIQNKIK
jgi:hypothetical protein